MKKLLSLLFVLASFSYAKAQLVDFTSSSLPIMRIITNGQDIPGDYKITDGNVILTVLVTKGSAEVYRYEINGTATETSSVAASVINKALDWLKKK